MKDVKKYKFPKVVERLEAFIENHEAIKLMKKDSELMKVLGIPVDSPLVFNKKDLIASGLCAIIFDPIFDENFKLGEHDLNLDMVRMKYQLFETWKYYSGFETFPVGGSYEFYSIKNVADNPLRLDLAKHLLEGFKNEYI